MRDRHQQIYHKLKKLVDYAFDGERVVYFCEPGSYDETISILADIIRVHKITCNASQQCKGGGFGYVRVMTCDARRFHLDVGEKLVTHRFHRYDVEPNIQEVFEADLLERARCFDAKLGKAK